MQNQKWRFIGRALATTGVAGLVFSLSTFAGAQDEHTPEQAGASQVAPYRAPEPMAVRQRGTVLTPQSSVARPEDAGLRAHTNYLLFAPAERPMASVTPDNTFAEYPASIACVYGVGPKYAGCAPANNGKHASGGWGAIALVDAYDDPNAASDIAYFASYFKLPKPKFSKVYANSSFGTLGGLVASCSGVPASASANGWDVEEALDIEWSFAMAPAAKIILVEACTNSYNDLLYAEYVAGIYVSAAGGGSISNSWSSGEFSSEINFDSFFYRNYWQKITYFASAGDAGWGAGYPSSSPWIISAGGTTINRDSNGNYLSESCWGGSGGGVSTYEVWQNPPNIFNGMGPWTNYQYPFAGQSGRQTPDISFDADPASGVFVYNTASGGTWYVVGGTSLSSPALAGIVNASKQELGQAPTPGGFYANMENNLIYSQLYSFTAYPKNFYDVTTGSNGSGHNAGAGYDQCTGVGSPRAKLGK